MLRFSEKIWNNLFCIWKFGDIFMHSIFHFYLSCVKIWVQIFLLKYGINNVSYVSCIHRSFCYLCNSLYMWFRLYRIRNALYFHIWKLPAVVSYLKFGVFCVPGASTGVSTHDKSHAERTWHAKVSQDSEGPLDLLEHLPQNQNLSVLLFYDFYQLLWH